MYENWKILKTELEEKQEEYSTVAEWCNDSEGYYISEVGDYYMVVKREPHIPTDEEQKENRAFAYQEEVDTITAHISRLRDTIPMTEEIEQEIALLIEERNTKVQEIKERFPYSNPDFEE